MKTLFILMLVIVSSCSKQGGGGGGSGGGETAKPTVVYIYPANSLEPGQGIVSVDPIEAKCIRQDGSEADASECPILNGLVLSNAPKQEHKSPAGQNSVVVANSDEGTITVTFAEGESWDDLIPTVKVQKAAGLVTCSSGFDYTYKASCDVAAPEYSYGPWPATPASCSGQVVQNRSVSCVSNITGVTTNIGDCSALTLDDSRTVPSPAGSMSGATLPNGDVVTVFCQQGADLSAIGTLTTVTGTTSCGQYRGIVNGECAYLLTCVGDTYFENGVCLNDEFTATAFTYATPSVGSGPVLMDAESITTCIRTRESLSVDVSKCSMPTPVPQQIVNSPAGTFTMVNSDGDTVSYTLAVGEVFNAGTMTPTGVQSCGYGRENVVDPAVCVYKAGVDTIEVAKSGFLLKYFNKKTKFLSEYAIPTALNPLFASGEVTGVYEPTKVRKNIWDIFTLKSGGLWIIGPTPESTDLFPNAIGAFQSETSLVIYDEDGVGTILYDMFELAPDISGVDFRTVESFKCFAYYTDVLYPSCLMLYKNGNLVTYGAPLLQKYHYANDTYSTPVDLSAGNTTNIKDYSFSLTYEGYAFAILKTDGTLSFFGNTHADYEGEVSVRGGGLATITNVSHIDPAMDAVLLFKDNGTVDRLDFFGTFGITNVYNGAKSILTNHTNHLYMNILYFADGTAESLSHAYPSGAEADIALVTGYPYVSGNSTVIKANGDFVLIHPDTGVTTPTGWNMNATYFNGKYLAGRMGTTWSFYVNGAQRGAWNANPPL